MTQKYLEQLSALLERAVHDGFEKVRLECKHFFSGAAVYANGKICMSLTPVGFAVKLPEKSRRHLLKQGRARPLRYFPKGPIKKDYVLLPAAALNDPRALRRWIKRSVEYTASLPKDAKKRS
ncbi:MAG TPA: TfoX/Sxy family protein [Xanthobacteraceae bacterium]|nr:TfoX/Sxy family protein [Xanthobacteraceae bacterium]